MFTVVFTITTIQHPFPHTLLIGGDFRLVGCLNRDSTTIEPIMTWTQIRLLTKQIDMAKPSFIEYNHTTHTLASISFAFESQSWNRPNSDSGQSKLRPLNPSQTAESHPDCCSATWICPTAAIREISIDKRFSFVVLHCQKPTKLTFPPRHCNTEIDKDPSNYAHRDLHRPFDITDALFDIVSSNFGDIALNAVHDSIVNTRPKNQPRQNT